MILKKTMLTKKLKALKAFIPSRCSIPAAMGVLIANGEMSACNLETTVTTKINTDSNETFVLPMSAIEFIFAATSEEIELVEESGVIKVKAGKSTARFAALNAEDFPTEGIVNLSEGTPQFECDAEEMMERFGEVMYATDRDVMSAKPVLSGVLMCGKKGQMNFVATDGMRIAQTKMKADCKTEIVVHRDDIAKFRAMRPKGKMRVYCTTSGKAAFETEEYSIYFRTLTGDFIDYERLYKKQRENANQCSTDAEELAEILKRAIICGGSQKKPAVLNFGGGTLSVRVNAAGAEFEETLEIQGDSKDVKIGVNAAFLLDALKAVGVGKTEILYSGETAPILLVSGELEQMIMPVRL